MAQCHSLQTALGGRDPQLFAGHLPKGESGHPMGQQLMENQPWVGMSYPAVGCVGSDEERDEGQTRGADPRVGTFLTRQNRAGDNSSPESHQRKKGWREVQMGVMRVPLPHVSGPVPCSICVNQPHS